MLGYDVAARINYALGADAFAFAGRMTHSFGGTFGAGAAAAALLGFEALQARHLLSYCAQQASGVGSSVRDGDHIEKAFDFGGMPARNGIAAATMVAAGFTGVDDVFSGERNFFQAYAAAPDPAKLADGLGERFEILGTNIKKWSAGSPAQSAIDALLHLMEHEGRHRRRHQGDHRASADRLGPHRRPHAGAGRQRPAPAGDAADRRHPDVPLDPRSCAHGRSCDPARCGQKSR